MFSRDIGIDLGTASVLVHVQGRGVVLCEPSLVVVDTATDRIIKVGREAYPMIGKTPANMVAIRPLKDGVISHYDVTLKMLQYFLHKTCGNMLFPPRVMICIPSGVTEVEARAAMDAATQAGARKAFLIEEPLAAAIGAGVDMFSPKGHMIVDIGGGTTDIAVLSMGGIVVSESIKVAGNRFDDAVKRYVREKYHVLIGDRSAEDIKRSIGTVWRHATPKEIPVKGRCEYEGLPKVVTLSSREMLEAMQEPVRAVLDAIIRVIEKTPPDLVSDVLKNGIVMTGGGSLLRGFDALIADITGIPTRVAKDAIACVARGTGMVLENLSRLPEGKVDLSCVRRR